VRHTVADADVEAQVVANLYAGCAGERMFDGLELAVVDRKHLRAAKDTAWLAMRDSTLLMNGVGPALEQLSTAFVLAVATTADIAYVTGLLGRDNMLRHVSSIVTDHDVAHPKPAPDMVLRLMEEFGVTAGQTCLVGDSRTDYEMSRAAHVEFIRFASHPGAAGVDAPSVASWAELARVLLRTSPDPARSSTSG